MATLSESRFISEKQALPVKTIVQVAEAGQLAELLQLLDDMDPADIVHAVNKHCSRNNGALHYAAHNDNLDMVKLLVKNGADVNDVGEDGRRPLHFAAAAKKDEAKADAATIPDDGVVIFLVSKHADVNAEDNRDRTPLHIATSEGNTEAVVELLSKSEMEVDLMAYDDNYNSPLHIAFSEGSEEIARRIIEKAIDTDTLKQILMAKNINSFAPIHLAVREGHTELVELYLEHVLKANQKEDGGGDDDQKESGSDDDDEMEGGSGDDDEKEGGSDDDDEKEGGSDDDDEKEGGSDDDDEKEYVSDDNDEDLINYCGGVNDDTPLHEACLAGHRNIAKMLLEKGAQINKMNWHSETPLHHACKANHKAVAIFLVQSGADMKAKDDEGLTPLQVAANSGSFDTVIDILKHVKRVNGKAAAAEFLKWSATKNKVDTLQFLLKHGDKLHGVNDDDDIDALVLDAARKGHTDTVKTLIRYGKPSRKVVDKLDDKLNTPLHLASEAGHDLTVQELIMEKARINETNMGEQTPLHLACKNGHIDVVKLLIEKADIVLRDKQGLNCLDYAIDNGHEDIAIRILDHEKWHEVMSVSNLYEDAREMTTPMRKLIKNMPDVAELVMDKCIKVSPKAKPKDSGFWINFDYEFLEDSFSHWVRPKDSNDNVDSEDKYVKEEEDDEEDEEEEEGKERTNETSFTTKPNGQSDSGIQDNNDKPSKSKSERKGPYDDHGHLTKNARPYTVCSKDIAANHPLTIMVSSERTDLLGHPLVSSLLNHKWNRVGWYFFFADLSFYLLFVAMLTGYIIVVPPSYYVRHANHSAGVTWFVNGEQRWTAGFHEATLFFFGRIGDWIILVLSVTNVYREVFLLMVQKRSYFSFTNLLEWSLYVLAILFILPLSGFQYIKGISIRLDWQWQCGAVAVFLAWINLLLFIRRVSALGIYVIMFTDILRTFMKFVLIIILFVVAFALAFYTLLMNQQPFHSAEYSFAKTFAMMIGELDFGDIFHSRNYLGTENTLADGEEDSFLNSVFYEGITYAFFALFFVIMSILIMNLLVGLAVDDIHAIQEKAKLHRITMQVELAIEVQQTLPMFMWRSAVIRGCEKYYDPNQSRRSSCLQKLYRTLTGDKNLQKAFQVSNKTRTQGDKHDIEMTQLRDEQKQMKGRFNRQEKKIDAILNHLKVKYDE